MSPVELARKAHSQFRLLAGTQSEVDAYAASIVETHVLDLGDSAQAMAPLEHIEVSNTAEVSDRLLTALFGQWPPQNKPRR
jgi:hypothetical protein